MNTLIEPFFYCLLASLIWAPAVFITAAFLAGNAKDEGRASALSGKVWPAALMLAALPVLMAPVAATLGLSLRAPAPLPEMVAPHGVDIVTAVTPEIAVYAPQNTVSLADILRMSAVLYFYGFLMLLALAAVRHIWFAYRLNYAYKLDEPRLEEELEAWRVRIGVKRQPRYVFSHIVSSVCVYGFFRPVIVMPLHLLDRVSIEDAALMGAHEMAHIKRGDVALFALCSFAKAVFWFNPFMHQICARANLTAEQGADALVLASGVNRRQYAHCFVQGLRLAAGARQSFTGDLVPSFTPFDKHSRRKRLDAILSGSMASSALSTTTKLGLGAGAMVAAGLAFAQAAFAVSPPAIEDALTVKPVEGKVSLAYGAKNKLLDDGRSTHKGIDIKAKRGTPIHASGDGKVLAATDRYQGEKSWGNVVVIDHGHGLVTRYAHLKNYVVEKGDYVHAGDVIGAVGASGVASGPHLHFEVIAEGENIDPTLIAAPAPAPVTKVRAVKKRNVLLAEPVALAAIAPVAAVAPPAPTTNPAKAHELDERNARKQEKKLQRMEEKLRKQFESFDAFDSFEDMSIKFGNLELEGFEGAEELAQLFENSRAELKELSDFAFVTSDLHGLSEQKFFTEEKAEALRESQREVMTEFRERVAEHRDEREEALREVRMEAREYENERKELDRELKRERKQHEAELKRMHREAEKEIKRAEKEWAREYATIINERELLEQREQALRNEKQNLELELKEIRRRRSELNESERNAGN